MRIYISCCFETDEYVLDDFRNGGYIQVAPMGPQGPMPFIKRQLPAKMIDELSDSVTLKAANSLKERSLE